MAQKVLIMGESGTGKSTSMTKRSGISHRALTPLLQEFPTHSGLGDCMGQQKSRHISLGLYIM